MYDSLKWIYRNEFEFILTFCTTSVTKLNLQQFSEPLRLSAIDGQTESLSWVCDVLLSIYTIYIIQITCVT